MFPTRQSWRPLTAALLVLVSSAGMARETLEEIVVTADFRERAASDLPVSVSVLGEERIREAAVQHFEELIYAVPNLNWSGDGNRARYLQIRGVGELEQYEGAPNPSVGFLIDDIDFSGIGTVATLFDIERIEVLRGPQGTRYGANALAGLVYVQSAAPTEVFEARARVTAGGDDQLSGGAALGGPLAGPGGPRYRASLHHHESDGFRDNPYLGRDDTNGRSETTARGRLDFELGDAWSLRLAALYVDVDDGYDAFAIDNSLTVLSDRPGRDAQESLGASLRASRDIGEELGFTSITSLADSDIDFSFDADWGNPESWAPFVYDYRSSTSRRRRTLSQEFRLSASRQDGREWTFGVYALALDESLRTVNQGVYEDLVVYGFTDSLDERFTSEFEALNLAAFGQRVTPIGENGELTLGLRVENRSTEYRDSQGLALDPSETMFGGELAYAHRIGDDRTAYVTLSRGYKAGGFNLGVAPEGQREFGAEALWNLEAGLKSAWLDGRLQANLAIFANRRDDQQVRSSVQLDLNDPASFVFFTDNAARGETLGLEADFRWFANERLELYASVGLLDATFDSFDGENADLAGREQAHAPAYSAAAGAILRSDRGWFARIDVSARDEFFFDVSHDRRSEAFMLTNLRAGYEAERWSAAIWARNLFDEVYAVRGFFFGNEPPDFPPTLYIRRGDPRQVGVTIDVNF